MSPFEEDIENPLQRWYHWMDAFPPTARTSTHTSIEIWRKEWPGPQIINVRDLYPAMNIYGLYWRLVQ